MTNENAAHHIVSNKKLVMVWLVLLCLTYLTVWVAHHNVGIGHVWGSLAIACIKSALVVAIFMHMKYEGRLLRWLLFLALATMAIFIGFTFFDVLYR